MNINTITHYKMGRVIAISLLLFTCLGIRTGMAQSVAGDELFFGNSNSERSHSFIDSGSRAITGGLKQTARVLLPIGENNWKGGSLSFVMKVDPVKQNYFTIRLWGSDVSDEHLILLVEGKQIGYRHLGDIEALDMGTEGAPFKNNQFFYRTNPLPLILTKGKNTLRFTIQGNGRIWGYGSTWEKYQYAMSGPTRGIYSVYTHTNSAFEPAKTEKQGDVLTNPPLRQQPGKEVLTGLKKQINTLLSGLISSDKNLSQVQMQLLAKAYEVKWTVAYHNAAVIKVVEQGLDHLYAAYQTNPVLAHADPATYNPEWFGLGICGQIIHLLYPSLMADLDKELPGFQLSRRAAYTQMLTESREWHKRNRRQYTNQSMINDLYGIYYSNKGIAELAPDKADPEESIKRYLYESVGLQPWSGSETGSGPDYSAGKHYMQLTPKGLTKELGFVGYYGEVLDWATEIYNATRPAIDQPGDEKIKAQLEKLALARAWFRYPALDAEGNKAMRIETIIGWRDTHYPGDVTYAQRSSWDGSPLQTAAATLNPRLIGYIQQMFSDNQFFATLTDRMKDKGFRSVAGLLPIPDEYELLVKQPATPYQLPMSGTQPDMIFGDTQDGVIALKDHQTILYVSLYWRARNAINFLAKVHEITPAYDRIATVAQDEQFEHGGLTYTRPDWTNFGFGNGGLKYPEDVHSAHAGEVLPIAKIPADVKFKPGQENMFAGRASFYSLEYGRYLIAMNTTTDKSFELKVPAGFKGALNLATKTRIGTAARLTVGPDSFIVLTKNQ